MPAPRNPTQFELAYAGYSMPVLYVQLFLRTSVLYSIFVLRKVAAKGCETRQKNCRSCYKKPLALL